MSSVFARIARIRAGADLDGFEHGFLGLGQGGAPIGGRKSAAERSWMSV